MEGSDYRNWPTHVIRGSGSRVYYARLTQPPPGTTVSNTLATGVGLKLENLQGMSTVDTFSIFSATKKSVLLIFHKGVIEMNRGQGVPKIAAGQFAKVKHATAKSPHLYGLVVAVAHTPESVPNFLGGVRVVLAMAVADPTATVATGDRGAEMVFLERSQIELQPEQTDHLHMHFSTQRTRPQGPNNMKAWAQSDMVKRAATAFLANSMLTDANTYKITKSKGTFNAEWPQPTAAPAASETARASRGGGAGGRGISIVPFSTGAGAAGGAAAAAADPAKAPAADAASAAAAGSGASAAATATAARHGLAKKQQEQARRQLEQQADIEQPKMIARLKETQQHPSADAKQMADLKKLVADVQLLHRNGADGGGGAAPRGGGGGRGTWGFARSRRELWWR